MAVLIEVAEGITAELGPFTLRRAGAPRVLTGATVALVLTPAGSDVPADTTSDLRIADQAEQPGQVYYTPDAGDFLASGSPYKVHFQVTQAGDVTFHPRGAPDLITVYRP